jgi:hypothetical protein
MYLLNQLSFALYLRTWTSGSENSYYGIWAVSIGKRTSWIAGLCVMMAMLLITQSKMNELSFYVPAVLTILCPSAPSFVFSPWFLQYLCVVIILIPLLCSSRYRWWGWIGWLSLGCLVAAIICLTSYFLRTQASAFAA